MDEAAIEARALQPLQPDARRASPPSPTARSLRPLARHDAARRRRRAQRDELLHRQPVRPVGGAGPGRAQRATSLPDAGRPRHARPRRTTSIPSPRMAEMRAKYQAHIAKHARAGRDRRRRRQGGARLGAGAPDRARRTRAARTPTDVKKANNHWTRAEFDTAAPGIDWARVLRRPRASARSRSSWSGSRARSPGISALVASQPLDAWKDYLAFHAVERCAPCLPDGLRRRALRLPRHRARRHAAAARPLEARRGRHRTSRSARRSASSTCESYFPPAAKARAEEMVAQHAGRLRPAHRRAATG